MRPEEILSKDALTVLRIVKNKPCKTSDNPYRPYHYLAITIPDMRQAGMRVNEQHLKDVAEELNRLTIRGPYSTKTYKLAKGSVELPGLFETYYLDALNHPERYVFEMERKTWREN